MGNDASSDVDPSPGDLFPNLLRHPDPGLLFTKQKPKYEGNIKFQGETQTFQLLGCVCSFDGTVYLKGRKDDGRSLSVEIEDYVHYFYLSRQKPFSNHVDASKFLHVLNDFVETKSTYVTANFYGAKARHEKTAKTKNLGHRREDLICKWQLIKGVYKDFFGWKPRDERETVLKIYVNVPYDAKRIQELLESEEFLSFYAKRYGFSSFFEEDFAKNYMVKTYQAAIDPAFNFRLEANLTTCKWCSVKRYAKLTERSSGVRCDESISCCVRDVFPEKEMEHNAPLLRMGYDIECAGKIMETGEPRFPVALWTVNKLQSYAKEELGLNPEGKTGPKPERWKKMLNDHVDPEWWIRWIRTGLQALPKETLDRMKRLSKRTELEQFVPSLADTDPVIIIACPLHREGVDDKDKLEFHDKTVFAYQPHHHRKIERLDSEEYGHDLWGMSGISCKTFSSEAFMICAFVEHRASVSPDVLDSWNGKSFDEVYLWERLIYLKTYGTEEEKNRIAELGDNFGLIKSGRSKYTEYFKKTKGGGEFLIKSVTTDLMLQNDGMMVALHPSYGDNKRKVFSLDAVAMDTLVYSADRADKLMEAMLICLDDYKTSLRERETETGDGNEEKGTAVLYGKEELESKMITGVLNVAKTVGIDDLLKKKEDSEDFETSDIEERTKLREALKKKLMGFQMRKMQLCIKEGTDMWKRGGKDFWRFVMYCYIDACLTVLLGGKLNLQLALAKATNVALPDVIGKGTQLKSMHLYYSRCFYSPLKYLIPDQSHHYFHWPGVFNDERGVWVHLKENARLRPNKLPEKSTKKNYMGARVIDPVLFGLIRMFVGTSDFSGLYPSIMNSYALCYCQFMNSYTVRQYGVRRYEYSQHVLGPQDIITCGESVYDPKLAKRKGYEGVQHLKVALFHQSKTSVTKEMLLGLADLRSVAKDKKGHYGKCLHSLSEYQRLLEKEGTFDINLPIPEGAEVNLYGLCKSQFDEGMPFGAVKRTASSFVTIYDEEQLAMKLCGNGTYGFTAVNDLESFLPCMEIGASVTAMGRELLTLSKVISQSLNGNVMDRFLAAKAERTSYLASIGKGEPAKEPKMNEVFEGETEETFHLPSRLKRKRATHDVYDLLSVPNKVYVSNENNLRSAKRICTIAGDTDSVMNLFTSKKLTDDFKNTKHACDSNRYVAELINQYQGDCTKIEHEKVAYPMSVRQKKNYTMQKPMEYNNGQTFELLEKGKKGDTLPFTQGILDGIERIYKERPDYSDALNDVRRVFEKSRNSDIVTDFWINECFSEERRLMEEIEKLSENPGLDEATKIKTIKARLRSLRGANKPSSLFYGFLYLPAVLKASEKYDVAVKCVELVHVKMEEYYRKEVDLSLLSVTKKIRKLHYDNNNEAFSVVEKKVQRGEPFSAGNKIIYVFEEPELDEKTILFYCNNPKSMTTGKIKPKNYKGFEIAEDYYYVVANDVPVNLWYTYVHKIRDPIVSYLRHVVCPLSDVSYLDKETMTSAQMARAEKKQEADFKLQDRYVKEKLFFEFENKMMQREKMRVLNAVKAYQHDTLKQNTLFSNGFTLRLAECSMCFTRINVRFKTGSVEVRSFDDGKKKTALCDACKNDAPRLETQCQERMNGFLRDLEDARFACRTCLTYSDSPDMNPDHCQSIQCQTYKTKKTLQSNAWNMTEKITALRNHRLRS